MNTLESALFSSPAALSWKKIGIRQHHGINLPLFSLHSSKSSGIGEFFDLLPLLPWCKKIGFDVIQLLPLNDTGPETSPYNALSAYALNPIHLSLHALPNIDHLPELSKQLSNLHKLCEQQRINYPKVNEMKQQFLNEYFQQASEEIMRSEDYQQFVNLNPWLEGYALFKSIKENRQWQSWEEWPDEIQTPSPNDYSKLLNELENRIKYHFFLQYLCFKQLKTVKEEAKKLNIFLKGDIPILINRESADVWLHSHLFQTEFSAGSPPDMYSKEGQYWGFPIYNWEELDKQNYQWWRQRLIVADQLYDIYRIDHVVGFYRIWAIPKGLTGKDGKFTPENPVEWIVNGEKIMRVMLEDHSMLPIGEDLGVVPTEVRQNLLKLGICGTKVMRWERMWEEDKRFIKPEDYLIESMTTVSTHDSDTLTLWWKNNPDEAEDFAKFKGWEYSVPIKSEQLIEILRDSHHTASLFHINLLNEYLAIIPGLTWPNPEDERINFPGIVSDLNWTYRFRPSVEEIIANKELADVCSDLIRV